MGGLPGRLLTLLIEMFCKLWGAHGSGNFPFAGTLIRDFIITAAQTNIYYRPIRHRTPPAVFKIPVDGE